MPSFATLTAILVPSGEYAGRCGARPKEMRDRLLPSSSRVQRSESVELPMTTAILRPSGRRLGSRNGRGVSTTRRMTPARSIHMM